MRESIDANATKSVFAGLTLSLQMSDAIFGAAEECRRRLLQSGTPSTNNEQTLNALFDLCRRNARVSRIVTDAMLLNASGSQTNNLDMIRKDFVKQIDAMSKDLFLERYGYNVLAIQKAGNKPTYARGFYACVEFAPERYSAVDEDPTGINSIAYYLAVEHYVMTVSLRTKDILTGLSDVSYKLSDNESAFSDTAMSVPQIRTRVLTYDPRCGGLWNRLFLKGISDEEENAH